MKKIFPVLLLALLLSGSALRSQYKPVRLGLQVSPNISWMSPKTQYYESDGISGGVTIGLISDFYFSERYAFSSGVNFAFLNGKIKYPELVDSTTGTMNRKYNIIYLEIPTLIKMETKRFGSVSLYGQIGFSTGFRLTATTRDDFEPDETQLHDYGTVKNDAGDNTSLIRESVVIGLGLQYHLDESSAIIAGFTYSNALNNVLNGYNNKTGLNEKALLNMLELKLGFIF